MIDFRIEPDCQAKLDWRDRFVRHECEAMDLLLPGLTYDVKHARSRAHLKPLQAQVKAQGLWACQLGEHLGGPADVHRAQIARTMPKATKPVDGLFPSEHIPTRLAAARERYPEV